MVNRTAHTIHRDGAGNQQHINQEEFLLGSVTKHVLDQARSDVLVAAR